jgi:hypothetical protein
MTPREAGHVWVLGTASAVLAVLHSLYVGAVRTLANGVVPSPIMCACRFEARAEEWCVRRDRMSVANYPY